MYFFDTQIRFGIRFISLANCGRHFTVEEESVKSGIYLEGKCFFVFRVSLKASVYTCVSVPI